MTTARPNGAGRRRQMAGRVRRESRRSPPGHLQRGRWTLAEMRQRAPDWREDVERERQRRVERGLPPQIEDVTVLGAIAEIIRLSEMRRREQAGRASAPRRRSRR